MNPHVIQKMRRVITRSAQTTDHLFEVQHDASICFIDPSGRRMVKDCVIEPCRCRYKEIGEESDETEGGIARDRLSALRQRFWSSISLTAFASSEFLNLRRGAISCWRLTPLKNHHAVPSLQTAVVSNATS